NPCELIRFGFPPKASGNRPQSSGKDQQRRPPVQPQLRAAFGDRGVVTAEHQNHVRGYERMLQTVIVPDSPRQGADPIVHRRAAQAFFIARIARRRRTPATNIGMTAITTSTARTLTFGT